MCVRPFGPNLFLDAIASLLSTLNLGLMDFLVPTGTQGVTMSVRLSVCLSVRDKFVQSSQSSSFWLKSLSNQSGISQQSLSTQRALRQHSDSTQRALIERLESSKLSKAVSCLKQSIFIFLGQRAIEQSESTQKALKEHSESSQIIKIRVIQSEPKILRLVKMVYVGSTSLVPLITDKTNVCKNLLPAITAKRSQ